MNNKLNSNKMQILCGRGNGKSFNIANMWLNREYQRLKKQHKYIKALKLRKLIKKFNK